MPNPLAITLTDGQRAELEDVRGHHPLPYMRERAAAILKIADGVSGREAARHRLLRPHWPDTIYEWVRRYQAEGVAGLKIRPGRGRKPAFSPRYADKETAREALLHTIHQVPQDVGQKGARWTLQTFLAANDWLNLHTLPGMCQLLQRLKIHWKRARHHVHSPDPDYVEKLHTVRINLLGPEIDQSWVVFLFQDELTFYRHPSLFFAYEEAGRKQPLAELGWKSNYSWRIAANLNAWTGQVTYAQGKCFDIPHLVAFYQQVTETYPMAQVIKMAQDNWPVHFHPDVLAALQPQEREWPLHVPANWPTEASPGALRLNLPIQILPLPTYASWTNPAEKLWRLTKQEVLHLHRFGDDWPALKLAVTGFLDEFATGSKELLRYVGLSDPTKLYRSLFPEEAAMPRLRY